MSVFFVTVSYFAEYFPVMVMVIYLFFNIGLSSFSVAATNHQHFRLKAALITQLLLCHQMDARLSLSMKVTQANCTDN